MLHEPKEKCVRDEEESSSTLAEAEVAAVEAPAAEGSEDAVAPAPCEWADRQQQASNAASRGRHMAASGEWWVTAAAVSAVTARELMHEAVREWSGVRRSGMYVCLIGCLRTG